MVPTKISDAYFTRDLLDGPASEEMTIYGHVTKRGISNLDGDAIGLDSISGEPLVVLKGCCFSGFRGVDSLVSASQQTYLFHQLDWKPDISLMSTDMIAQYCIEKTRTLEGGGIEADFERVARYFMAAAIEQVSHEFTLTGCEASLRTQLLLKLAAMTIWNLHHALPGGLDFFVLLSSLAGVHGASSQSNYAAGSAFLDAFARYRHSRGERCISLDLGLVESIGYVAERIDVAQTLAMTYTDQKYLTEGDLHFMLRYACKPPYVDASSPPWDTQLICSMTTPAFVQRAGTVQDYGWMRSPMFCHLYQMEFDTGASTAVERADSAGTQLKSASSVEEAAGMITSLLAKRLARSLSVPVESIDTKKPPSTFGVDSLVAVELLHWFSTEIRTEIPVVQILGSMSIAELARIAAETSDYLVD
ncbi:hypothetical protein SCAR479_00311 [Seiridium cardinale]|uniref:Carrier domain-containing protein n=1 Tax=Seiridium cardinale TaxID=138064 RepID=A0ABR2Y9H1_9PEZI